MSYHGEVDIMLDCFRSEGDVGDVVWWALRKDAAEATAAFEYLGVIFAPEFEFVIAAYGGEELAEGRGEPLYLWDGLVWILLTGGNMSRASSISASCPRHTSVKVHESSPSMS